MAPGDPGATTTHVICAACFLRANADLDVVEAAAAEPPVIPDVERLIEETQRVRRIA